MLAGTIGNDQSGQRTRNRIREMKKRMMSRRKKSIAAGKLHKIHVYTTIFMYGITMKNEILYKFQYSLYWFVVLLDTT